MNWYLSRLASMGPSELLWRGRVAAILPIDWIHFRIHPSVPMPGWTPFSTASYPIRFHDHGTAMEHFSIFDLDFPVDFAFDWHHDYRNNKSVERRFSAQLDIRNPEEVGDIKYIWEVNRHQHLSELAYATNGKRYTEVLVRAIRSWHLENPYLNGVNWTSSLELALRVISWALIYPTLACYVESDSNFRDLWLASIYLHLSRIAKRLSLYSSANNHLIGELVGLYVGASCFPFWEECTRWRDFASRSLEREILLQVSHDGVNLEQAMSYHLCTLELLLLAFAVGRNCGRPFCDAYAGRLRTMLQFLNAIATPAGDLPWYGDSDDARGFLFAQGESALQVTTQLGALLLDEPALLRFGSEPTAATLALIPDLIGGIGNPKTQSSPSNEMFSEGGIACLRTDDGIVRLIMDFGALGYTSIAAHGHADALSVWLAIGDEYLIVDSGTYSYHSHPEWREYFRGTSAHNTARVDEHDQSRMAGRFIWSYKAKTRLLRFEESIAQVVIEAEHDGYTRLKDPVVHRRKLIFDRGSGHFTLADSFSCTRRHTIELFFHLHEEATISQVEGGIADVLWNGSRISFRSLDTSLAWEVICGSETPMLGWRSRAFNKKKPTPTLRLRAEINGTTVINTQVDLNR